MYSCLAEAGEGRMRGRGEVGMQVVVLGDWGIVLLGCVSVWAGVVMVDVEGVGVLVDMVWGGCGRDEW